MLRPFILFLLIINSNAHAQWLGLGQLFGFAEENRTIVTKLDEVAPLSNPNFHLTNEQADTIKSLTALDKEIEDYAYSSSPGDCDEQEAYRKDLRKKIENREVRFLFAMTYSDRETGDNTEYLLQRDTYGSFIFAEQLAGKKALPSKNLDGLTKDYASTTGKNLDGKSVLERAKILESFIQEKYNVKVPKDYLIEEVLRDQMINNPTEWKKAASSVANDLTFDQKMRISARMGKTFLDQYNNDRYGKSNGKAVTVEELLNSAQLNTPGGVCRDISAAQSQFLQAMGVPKDKIYIVAYHTPRTNHSVLAVQDPNDPKRLVKLNYGEMTEDDQNTGGTALKQVTSLPDTGIGFRIFDASAKPLGRVPSEVGAMLKNITNSPTTFIEYTPYTLNKVTASGELGTFSVFTGKTTSGDNVIGAAFDRTFKDTKNGKSEFGIALAHREINSPIVDLDQNLIYGRISEEIYSNPLTLGKVQTRAEIGYESEVMYSANSGTKKESGVEIKGNTFDFSNTIFAGVSSVYESGETKVRAQTRVHMYPDFANETEAKKMTVVLDRVESKVTVETPLSPNVMALAEGGVVIRQYGEAAYIQSSLTDMSNNYRAFASYSTPIGDVPSFMPEASKTVGTGIEYKRGNWNFSASGTKDLTTKENRFHLGVQTKW